jgi:hypothetical protein
MPHRIGMAFNAKGAVNSPKPLPLPTKTTPRLFRGNFQNTMTSVMRNPGGGGSCSSCGH